MRQVNTKDGRTIWIDPASVCMADYDKEDYTAILTLSSGEVIRTYEYAPEILLDLGLLTESQSDDFDKQLLELQDINQAMKK